MEIVGIILIAIAVIFMSNIEQQSANNKVALQKQEIEDKARAVAREKAWKGQISISKQELLEFRWRFNKEPAFRAELKEQIMSACAEIPIMSGEPEIDRFVLRSDAVTDAFINFASMVYYAQYGKITYLWENGYIFAQPLNMAFERLFGHDVPGFAIELFFKWYQEELLINGFLWPEIGFVYEHKEGALSMEERPRAVYFINGTESVQDVRRHCMLND